ncbi:hypothetical protein MTR_1g025360 [Medicago truncatula]|uniref:Uncharacterized protein n=1 Tax=Medicago truncatula TaxID=3880 RepID=G7I7P7_MEDTR|nr:hypothetical protein MTR_1g025360 [Medicago truncatula]
MGMLLGPTPLNGIRIRSTGTRCSYVFHGKATLKDGEKLASVYGVEVPEICKSAHANIPRLIKVTLVGACTK